jgi:hypothetical protein
MWIAIVGAFVLVTVLFGQSQHRESPDGSTHPKPAVAEVAEPSLASYADGTTAIYKRD